MLLVYLKTLNKQIIFFIISLSVSIFIVMSSMQYWNEVIAENMKSDQRLLAAKNKHKTAILRTRILEEFKPRYDALEKRNIAGNENRTDWINLIELIATSEKIPFINYKIAQQITVSDAQLKKKYPGLVLNKSVMDLDMKFIHEGDLYTVLRLLNKKAMGLFDVSSCNLKKINIKNKDILSNKSGINFSAKCSLNWYSLQPKKV